MKTHKTLIGIIFFVLTAFIYPQFYQAVLDAAYTGTYAAIVNNLPLIFLLFGIVSPFIGFALENK